MGETKLANQKDQLKKRKETEQGKVLHSQHLKKLADKAGNSKVLLIKDEKRDRRNKSVGPHIGVHSHGVDWCLESPSPSFKHI